MRRAPLLVLNAYVYMLLCDLTRPALRFTLGAKSRAMPVTMLESQ